MLRKRLEPLTFFYVGVFMVTRCTCSQALQSHRSTGKWDEDLQACIKATELKPDYPEAWNNKGWALKILGRTTEADAAFAKASELGYQS